MNNQVASRGQARFSVFTRAVRISVISSRRLGEFATALSARRIRYGTLWGGSNQTPRRARAVGQSYLSQLSRQPGGQVSVCNGLAIQVSYHRGSPKPKTGPDPAKPATGLVTRRVPYERFQVVGYPPFLDFLRKVSPRLRSVSRT